MYQHLSDIKKFKYWWRPRKLKLPQLINFSHQTDAGFCREKVLRMLTGLARIRVTWFSASTVQCCLKEQTLAMFGNDMLQIAKIMKDSF
jgi:hypothetical protein